MTDSKKRVGEDLEAPSPKRQKLELKTRVVAQEKKITLVVDTVCMVFSLAFSWILTIFLLG
jgi:hypothetical protein